jgi:hypothetical protein
MKWPIETMYIGVRPTTNYSTASPTMLDSWDQYSQVTNNKVPTQGLMDYVPIITPFAAAPNTSLSLNEIDTGLGCTGAFNSFTLLTAAGNPIMGISNFYQGVATINSTAVLSSSQYLVANRVTLTGVGLINYWLGYYGLAQIDTTTPIPPSTNAPFANPAAPMATELNAAWRSPGKGGAGNTTITYNTYSPIVNVFNLEVHGIKLYNEIPYSFFNHYIPYTYGGQLANTPQDIGAYMITFNLYVGSYQPSGHINISRAREFYLSWNSNVIGSTVADAEFVIIACALNFLLISDGSAVLRFTT